MKYCCYTEIFKPIYRLGTCDSLYSLVIITIKVNFSDWRSSKRAKHVSQKFIIYSDTFVAYFVRLSESSFDKQLQYSPTLISTNNYYSLTFCWYYQYTLCLHLTLRWHCGDFGVDLWRCCWPCGSFMNCLQWSHWLCLEMWL